MPDDALRLQIQADVTDLKAKMVEASGSVESASAKMASALAAQGLSAKEIAQGLESVGLSAKGLVPAAETAATSVGRVGGAMGEARVIAGTLDGSVGMITGGFARLAAQSQALAPLISAAFPVIAAVALADILGMVVDKIDSVTASMAGYTAEVKKAEQADVEWSTKAISTAADVEQAHSKLSSVLSESSKIANESFGDKFSASLKQTSGTSSLLAAELKDPFAAITALSHAESDWANATVKVREENDKLVEHLSELSALQAREAEKLIDLQAAAKGPGVGPIERIENEIATLKQKQSLEEEISRSEVAEKGGDAAAQDRAVAAVREENYLRLIALQKELTAAQEESAERAKRQAQEDEHKATLPTGGIVAGMPDPALFQASNEKIADEGQQGAAKLVAAWQSADDKLDEMLLEDLNRQIQMREKADEKTIEEASRAAAKIQSALEAAKSGRAEQMFSIDMEGAFQKIIYGTQNVTMAFEKLGAATLGVAMESVNQPFTQALDNVMRGTETASLAFRKMGSEIIMNVVNALEQAVLKAIELKAITALMSFAGFGGGGIVPSFEHGGVVPSFARGGIVGWPSAAAGAVVPINAHAGEMVLPKDLSEGVQNAVRGGTLGGKQSGGGDTHNYHFGAGAISVHANDAEGFAKDLQRMIRRGNFRFR